MALEREGFESLLELTRGSFWPDLLDEEKQAILASWQAQFSGTLSPEQLAAIQGGAQLTETQLQALPERTEEAQATIDESIRLNQERQAEIGGESFAKAVEEEVLKLNPPGREELTADFPHTLQGTIAERDRPSLENQIRINASQSISSEFINDFFAQLGPEQTRNFGFTGDANQDRALVAQTVSFLREAFQSGQGPSAAVAQVQQILGQRELLTQKQEEADLFSRQQGELESAQELANTFLSEGGRLTERSLAEISQATTLDEARAIAAQSIQRHQAESQRLETQFQQERTGLGEELAGIGARELELAQPDIQRRLQALGILRSGEQIVQTQEAAERLESERQRILAGFGREDILQRRSLEQQFGLQSRELALGERASTQGQLQDIFAGRTGAIRQDITGGQQRQFTSTQNSLQRAFQAAENQKQRQFLQQQEMARIQRANALAEQQASQSRKGSFGNIAGTILGGAFGFTPFGMALGGPITTAGFGGALGQQFAGGGGGGSNLSQSLIVEGLLRSRKQKETESTTAGSTGGTAGVAGVFRG